MGPESDRQHRLERRLDTHLVGRVDDLLRPNRRRHLGENRVLGRVGCLFEGNDARAATPGVADGPDVALRAARVATVDLLWAGLIPVAAEGDRPPVLAAVLQRRDQGERLERRPGLAPGEDGEVVGSFPGRDIVPVVETG